MKHGMYVLAALACLFGGRTARADEATAALDTPPPTGLDVLGGGIALSAVGALSFATAPICKTGVVNVKEQGTCFTVSFLAGTPFLALGIPLVVYGVIERRQYDDWARRHPALSAWSLAPTPGGGALGFRGTF